MQILIEFSRLMELLCHVPDHVAIPVTHIKEPDVQYVFDDMLYGEPLQEFTSETYLNKLLDLQWKENYNLHDGELAFIAGELFPELLNELHLIRHRFTAQHGLFSYIEVKSGGVVVSLNFEHK